MEEIPQDKVCAKDTRMKLLSRKFLGESICGLAISLAGYVETFKLVVVSHMDIQRQLSAWARQQPTNHKGF